MAKVTSKLQLTVPKAVATRYGIKPGDELDWQPAGDIIRVIPPGKAPARAARRSVEERLNLFDRATQRQRRRQVAIRPWKRELRKEPDDRGWKREHLYTRGSPR